MIQTVDGLAHEIVDREGGYVNDPSDPGGATQYGVTIGTMRRLGLDLNHDGQVNEADVRALTRADAVRIFLDEYFTRPRIGALPPELQPPVFDMYVNAGSNAVKILQRVLHDLGYDIAIDGGIGPQTIRIACAEAATTGGVALADAYGYARREYYYALGDARPASRKYARTQSGGKGGWITRAEAFMSPTAAFTDAQHRARTARWT